VQLRRLALFTLSAALGCGAHLHRPQDAATAEGAEADLKAARLVDGFAEELAQSQAMLVDELDAARAWAEVGRNRDLLDVLAATAESDPETAILYHPRCQARFKGDGWTTLCSKLQNRLHALLGYPAPSTAVPDTSARPRKPDAAPTADPAADLLRELRSLDRQYRGPNSGESQIARVANEYTLAARALKLSGAAAPPPRCPVLDLPGRAPALQASVERLRGLCRARRENLRALAERIVCREPGCTSEIGAQVEKLAVVHDAVAAHHDELVRRLYAYEAAKRPCAVRGNGSRPPPGAPPAPPVIEPAAAPRAALDRPAPTTLSLDFGALGQGPLSMSPGAGWLAPAAAATPTPAPSPAPAPVGAPATCDEVVLQQRFAALGEIPVPPALAHHDLAPLARLGRVHQLDEQLAAVDALIEERQTRPRRRADTDEADATLNAEAPRFARALHATIEGIDRVQRVVDALELAVLALIRETLRVERDALADGIRYAEKRVRIDRIKLAAQLDEAALLLEAYVSLTKLERGGATALALAAAHEGAKSRDEVAKALLAFGNAWTLGRAAQKQADALDLGARHDASIARSRAAMAVRQVYLAAGVAELVNFNKGGLSPEALAQIVVNTVGFAVLAGGVYTR
jgi:hypothetical protein